MISHPGQILIRILPVLMLTLMAGCSGNAPPSVPVSDISAEEVNQATKFVPASRAEVEALIGSVDAAVAHQNVTAFNALIDEGKMVDRILAGLKVKDQFRARFMQSMQEGGGLTNLSGEILGAVEKGGDYTFVRVVQKGDEQRPLFRLALPNSGGMNYHELIVSVDANKQPRIADIYVYLSGELLSQSIRRLVLPAVAAEDPEILPKLTDVETEFLHHIATLNRINELSEAHEYRDAMKLLTTLPESLQKDKTVLLTRLLIAQQLSDEEYAAVMRELERHFPTDAARDFRSMDLLAIQGQHDDLVKSVDRLLLLIQDPYLNILKIDSLLALNRDEDARKAIAAVKEAAPNRIDVYWIETAMLLRDNDFAAVAAQLDQIGEQFGVKFNDLAAVPEYADFAASPSGKAWLARHNPQPAQPVVPSDKSPSAPQDEALPNGSEDSSSSENAEKSSLPASDEHPPDAVDGTANDGTAKPEVP